MKRAGQLLRALWLIIALTVIVYAVMIVAAREMLPLINRYQPEINHWLSEQTGMEFNISRLSGLWQGFTPTVDLETVSIAGIDGTPDAIYLDQISAQLSPVKSIANTSAVWRSLSAELVKIKLNEDEQGRWTIAGHPLGLSDTGGDLDFLYRMLFYSRFLRVGNVEIDITFYSGSKAKIIARDIVIENSGDFHRATAHVALDEWEGESAAFVFEGRGDPSDSEAFAGRGYLDINAVNIEGSLNILARSLFPSLAEKIGQVQTDLDIELWFDWVDSALVNGRGKMKAKEVPLAWVTDAPPMRDLQADITGWFRPGDSWGFRLQGLTGEWGEATVKPLDFSLSQGVGSRWGNLQMAFSHIDLSTLNGLLLKADLIPGKGREPLEALNPSGALERMHLDLDYTGDRTRFTVRSNLSDVSVDAWKGAPAARGVSGYIESGIDQGFVAFDCPADVALLYPQAFDDYMGYSCPRGKVGWLWQPEESRVTVSSSHIELSGDEGQAAGIFRLDLPTRKDAFEPQMFLMVGVENSHSRYRDRYIPRVLDQELANWLEKAVGDTHVPQLGFIWRGSLLKQNNQGRSIQLFATFNNGRLDYQPGWPELTELSGLLVVDNTRLDAWASGGAAGDARLDAGGVTLRQSPEGPVLRVSAVTRSPVQYGVDVLKLSPVSEYFQGLPDFEFSGDGAAEINLEVPLRQLPEGVDFEVRTTVSDMDMVLPGTGIPIAGIQGDLTIDNMGVESSGLTGRFLGGKVEAVVTSESGVARFDLVAFPSSEALTPYIGDAAAYLDGQSRFEGQLYVPYDGENSAAQLVLKSSLEGLAVILPGELGKGVEDEAALRGTVDFGAGNNILVKGTIADRAAVALSFKGGLFRRGTVQINEGNADLPEQDGLLIGGKLKRLDWQQWQSAQREGGIQGRGLWREISPHLDIAVDDLVISGFSLGNTHISGDYDSRNGWQLDIEAARLAGKVGIPVTDGEVVSLDLEYLKLPSDIMTAFDKDVASRGVASIDRLQPTDIPLINFSVDKLYLGEENLGGIAFSAHPIPSGVLFSDVTGKVRGIEIRPQVLEDGGEVVPAELRWTEVDEKHRSYFSGTLSADNFGEMLAGWGTQAPLTAKSSVFYSEVGWAGKPWEINLLALDGYIGMEFRDGQFYKSTGAATNTLFKLVSLINFDTWLRRLRFDFSDLFSGGVSFDKVNGGLLFRQGLVDFDDPIAASMPSGKIHLLGSADLIYEQLDARLVATLPVGTNLPWVAGLLGGLPAAAGVYLSSKIFEKQVDQLSSLSYTIKGSIDDPDIEVDRIFTDPTDLSKDQEKEGEEELQ